jgi:hypothetical protein
MYGLGTYLSTHIVEPAYNLTLALALAILAGSPKEEVDASQMVLDGAMLARASSASYRKLSCRLSVGSSYWKHP